VRVSNGSIKRRKREQNEEENRGESYGGWFAHPFNSNLPDAVEKLERRKSQGEERKL